jgi:hypothetical protein
MTEEALERFVAERSRVLAVVVLTRRDDLTVSEAARDSGLDLHVSIGRDDKPLRLAFGVVVEGTRAPLSAETAAAQVQPAVDRFLGLRKFTHPVCLFFFNMRDDRGYFSWLAEPVLTAGAPKLVHHTRAACVELTNELLGDIVDRIVNWYDAVEAVLIG